MIRKTNNENFKQWGIKIIGLIKIIPDIIIYLFLYFKF